MVNDSTSSNPRKGIYIIVGAICVGLLAVATIWWTQEVVSRGRIFREADALFREGEYEQALGRSACALLLDSLSPAERKQAYIIHAKATALSRGDVAAVDAVQMVVDNFGQSLGRGEYDDLTMFLVGANCPKASSEMQKGRIPR
jgi:hypothetical protein